MSAEVETVSGRVAAWAQAAGLVILAAVASAGARALTAPSASTVQLRVVGASNAPADQQVKLAVRDAVLAAVAPGLDAQRTVPEALGYLQGRLPAVRAVALAASGGQSVAIRLGTQPLPAHRMGLVRFPADSSPALVVTLGAGLGHNWWTVLFPPLALVRIDGQLAVVGPGGASTPIPNMDPAQVRALLAAVSRETGVPLADVTAQALDGPAGGRVQVRFLLWDALKGLPWRDLQGWLGDSSLLSWM